MKSERCVTEGESVVGKDDVQLKGRPSWDNASIVKGAKNCWTSDKIAKKQVEESKMYLIWLVKNVV